MTPPSPQPTRHAATPGEHTPADPPFPRATFVFFAISCILLVLCALSLEQLPQWFDDYGRIPVFLAFFLIMSLAGRWFWAGADVIISAVKNTITRR